MKRYQRIICQIRFRVRWRS